MVNSTLIQNTIEQKSLSHLNFDVRENPWHSGPPQFRPFDLIYLVSVVPIPLFVKTFLPMRC